MEYIISWHKKAQIELNKLPFLMAKRISDSVNRLKENPFSRDIKKLKETDWYRLRVGDYRVIFMIENNRIIILKIGHRKNIYD